MEDVSLLSVGIDIGTSTTQCVFSSMRLRNAAPAFAVPRVTLEDKKILYRAPVRLTPLRSADAIDAEGVRAMIERDYREAGIRPEQIACGAVILTGETARKSNARAVGEAITGFAGEFVVATAGPDLEAILAGKGAGAAKLSRERGLRVLNLDVGGGTTNVCLFDRGEVVFAGCADIGGRLLRREPATNRVLAFSEKLSAVAGDAGISLKEGVPMPDEAAARLAQRMAQLLEEYCGLRKRTPLCEWVQTEHALPEEPRSEAYTFSGGVAECVYGAAGRSVLFDDIGYLLGEALSRSRFFTAGRVLRPPETLNATVIGAGAYSMNVTGSTIACSGASFPLKGLPVARVKLAQPEDIPMLADAVLAQLRIMGDPCAIGFEGLSAPSFVQIEAVAEALSRALKDVRCPVIVMARDMAKALGQALMRRRGQGAPLVCLDGVALSHGDTIDIGAPLMDGRVLPIVVKTLAF